MPQIFNFFKTTMPPTRPADFYLGCLDSCIYLDFEKDENNCIFLKRISFDGFGCCELTNSPTSLNIKESEQFISIFKKDELDQDLLTMLVQKCISLNQDLIWQDAIDKYNLL